MTENVGIIRVGEERINYQGIKMSIISYRSSTDIDVKFEDGYISKHRRYNEFKTREIKSLLFPSVFNIGYLGDGEYKIKNKDGKYEDSYLKWMYMIRRCYDEKFKKKRPSYIGCIVCEEWHNYQNFAKWYEENSYILGEENMHLDKDLLRNGNKIYSPDTCLIVPSRINMLFFKKEKENGMETGVIKKGKRFQARICDAYNKKSRTIGIFDTKEDAFEAYKENKELYIKQVADEYKEKYPDFPKKVYESMYKYKIK